MRGLGVPVTLSMDDDRQDREAWPGGNAIFRIYIYSMHVQSVVILSFWNITVRLQESNTCATHLRLLLEIILSTDLQEMFTSKVPSPWFNTEFVASHPFV
jgi:hypothetical protein